MKFSEMPYQRPDIPALREKLEALRARIEGAQSADEAERAYRESDALSQQYATATSLAYIRHSIDTRDAFYDAENAFADENEPVVKEMAQAVNLALLRSPFRKELEARLGEVLFTNLEIEVRSFSPQNLALMQEENRLQSEYQKLYASALADWEGAKLPLPKLGPYKQSRDRATRRRAYEAEGRWFDAHREELDALYDALERRFSGRARWEKVEGGFSAWLEFPEGIDLREGLAGARDRGVLYAPGDAFYPDGRGRSCMRLGFSRLEPGQIARGIYILSDYINSLGG